MIKIAPNTGYFQCLLLALAMFTTSMLSGQTCLGTAPTASVFAIQPSCAADGSTINTDGYLQISEVTGGLSYQVAIDGGAFGPRADIGATFPAIILSSQSNPAGSRDYIVRIYEEDMSGASACFTDVPVTMQQQDCTVGCDCQEYIYLNDVFGNLTHKFLVNTPTGNLSEIGNPWLAANTIDDPHGLAGDINGNLYIADGASGQIYKVSCEGTLLEPLPVIPNPFNGTELRTTNYFSRDNILYIVSETEEQILAIDLCDYSLIGRMQVDGGLNIQTWGFYIDENNWYVPNRAVGSTNRMISGSLDISLYTDPPTNSGSTLFDFQDGMPVGMTRDSDGNFYVIEDQNNIATLNNIRINKYASDGTFIAGITTATNDGDNLTDGLEGWWGARGIVYSETTNQLHVSAQENCIAVFDTDLMQLETLNVGNPSGGNPKAIAVITECCPTNNNQVVEIVQCNTSATEPIFLNEIFPCEGGIICEAQWEPADASTMAVYDECNQTIMVGTAAGCYTFTRSSDGTGANAQCGAFVQSFTVSVSTIEAGLIIPEEQTICRGDDPEPIVATAATGTGGDISYQWYTSIESDSTGYSLIPAATELTYAPTAASLVSDTTYFRIVSNITTCTSGMCSDTSEAVFVVVLLDPLMVTAAASCDDENGMQVAANTYYIEVSAITGGDDAGSYEVTVTGATTPTQTFDGTGSLFFGPFTHSGTGGAVQVVSVQDNRIATACETLVEVPEILCGINDGGQAPGCFCDGPTTDPTVPTSFILAQSQPGTFMAGGSTGQIQKYVLVNAAGVIVAMNLTGLFEISTPGTYTPYAINYRASEDPDVTNALMPGRNFQDALDDLADACLTVCNIDTPVSYPSCACYSVGSTVFSDLDNNGMLDTGEGENGLTGVIVELYAAGATPGVDAPIGTTTTNSNGDYYFGGLDPADYFIYLPTTPIGYPTSSSITDELDNGEDNDDNGIQPLLSGNPVSSPVFTLGNAGGEPVGAAESGAGGTQDDAADAFGDMTLDFGFFAPLTVGDTTFVDLDMDGTQSAGDLPLANVTVTIYDVATGLPVALDADGNAYTATQLTDAITGAYLFENLPPGNYYVEFDISTNPNAAFYDFTTPNAGSNDATDSDAVPAMATDDVANSSATGPLLSGQSDLTLDAGVVCAIDVTVAEPFTICSTQPINLLINASITPSTLGGMWTASGDGSFLGLLGNELNGDVPFFLFNEAVTYIPGPEDIQNGYVILTLTTFNPPAASGCGPASDSVRIDILKVDCGGLPWDGQ